MPYKVYQEGEKYCVHKLTADGEKGEKRGCSDTRSRALAHMRALYAVEGGANMRKELDKIDRELSIEYLKEIGDTIPDPLDDEEDEDEEELDEEEEKAVGKREDVSAADRKRAVSEYGDVTYADPKNKKYPVDTEKHIRAAWSYINMPKNQKKYSSSEVASIKRKIVAAWKRVIDEAGPPQEAEKKETGLLDSIIDAIKSVFVAESEPEPSQDAMIWKEADGTYRWIARYSNNFRDVDNPPEIISEQSHKRFVDRVDKGLAPLPELRLFHRPEWTIGDATWVAYDDAGFSLAGGVARPGAEPIFEQLSNVKEGIWCSHGMPTDTIVRDPNDPTIIVEHESREITLLPRWAAANRLTGFVVLPNTSNKEDIMGIPTEKRNALKNEWRLTDEQLAAIEQANQSDADKALAEGIERKEVETPDAGTETPATPAVAAEVPAEPLAEPEAPETEPEEKATQPPAVDPAITAQIAELQQAVTQLAEMVKSLSKSDEEKIAAAVKETPTASQWFLKSVIGQDATREDGRGELAKSKPQEAKPDNGPTFVPFLNDMLTGPQAQQ